jgi:hypothetical protein
MFTSVCFSQDIVNATPINLKKNRDVFQIVDHAKNEIAFFVSDEAKVKAIRLDQNMQIVDSLSYERPNKKVYTNMIGYNGDATHPRLFWSSSDYKAIFTQNFDFESRKITTQLYQMTFKDERVLQNFSEKGFFYILTVVKNSNFLKLYAFDNEGKTAEKTIDLAGFHFFKAYDYKRTNLYGVLGENLLPFEAPFSLQKISTDDPTSLTDSAKKRKCYSNSNEIIITIDSNIDYTQLIILNLTDFTATEKIIKKTNIPYYQFKSEINSNSFLFDNKVYQVKSSSDKLIVSLKDFDDNLIKEYTVNADNPIDFKNSTILQEGGGFGGKRELENTSQFIRKVNNSNMGLSCYSIRNNTLITMGSVSELQQSSAMMMGGMFGLAGVLLTYAIANPTMESFNSYANRKVVKIDCLFDKEMNHITGELQPLAFDKIRTFFDKNTNVSSQTLYKLNDFYYLGYYDTKLQQYIIRKFAD